MKSIRYLTNIFQAVGMVMLNGCLLSISLPHTVQAQTVNDVAGVSMPLDNALGPARSAALGSAFVAVADDGAALFWNPAGLGNLGSGEMSLHYQTWIADTNQDTLLMALPMPGLGALGLAANYVNDGSFPGRDATGSPTAAFSA